MSDNKLIGAVFCAKNYKAIRYFDDDHSEWAIGYIYEKEVVENGYFFYPEFGIAIKLTTNSIWYWKTNTIYNIADLDLSKSRN